MGSQKLPSVLTLFTQHRRQELFFFASDGEVSHFIPCDSFLTDPDCYYHRSASQCSRRIGWFRLVDEAALTDANSDAQLNHTFKFLCLDALPLWFYRFDLYWSREGSLNINPLCVAVKTYSHLWAARYNNSLLQLPEVASCFCLPVCLGLALSLSM